MRIAFVSANRENMPDAVIPLGLLYVAAATPPGHEQAVWDLCFEPEPLNHLAERLDAFRPDLVAIGMRNIQSNDYSGSHHVLRWYGQVLETVRRHAPGVPVVLGGGGFSVMPRELMQHLQPDFGISGEGETAFARLVDALHRGDTEALHAIPALHRLHRDGLGQVRVVSNPAAEGFQDLDALARPDRRLLDPRHFQDYGIDSVQTKRGCPLKCDYCTYPLIEGKSIRQRDPVQVVDEMFQSLEQAPSIRHVFIVDSVFNLPPRHAKAVCRELIRRGWKVPWTAYANPIAFDEELAGLMVEASCAGVEIGSDSGVDAVLQRLRKGFDTQAIRKMHDICQRTGLRDCHTFILGTPGESLDDVCRTLDFCRELDPFAAIMMIWVDDAESLDPELAAERLRLRHRVQDLMRDKEKEFPRWIIPPLGVHFDPHLFGLLRRNGLAGPLWQYIHLAGGDARSRRLKRMVRERAA